MTIKQLSEKKFSAAPEVDSIQPIVQEKLGECLIGIQLFERHLQELLTYVEIQGTHDEFENNHVKLGKTLNKSPLGKAVDLLKKKFLQTEHLAAKRALAADASMTPVEEPVFRSTSFLTMSDESRKTVVGNLKKFVELRNLIVHGFIKEFDVWTIAGCEQAIVFLDTARKTIEDRLQDLVAWNNSVAKGRRMMASIDPEVLAAVLDAMQRNAPLKEYPNIIAKE